jgi:hypothetical protein
MKKVDRSSCWRCIEYWLKRGYSEEEGRKQISLKQSLISSKQPKGVPRSKETCEKIRLRAIERQNLSYWVKKHGESGIEKYNQYIQRLSDNGKKTAQIRKHTNYDYKPNTPRRKEFWIKRGYTEEQAAVMVAQTQSTFSLQKCLEKYGEEGVNVWTKRQERWKASFFQNDIKAIRKKQKQNAHVGYYSSKNIGNSDTLLFYLLLLDNNKEQVLKYGLTKQQTVQKRWGVKRKDFNYNILSSFRIDAKKAVELEQLLRSQFKNTTKTTTYKLTEIVDLEHYKNVQEIIETFIRSTNG